MLHAGISADDQNQIRSLASGLETEAAASHDEKHRRAPALLGAARRYSFAIIGAEYEACLQVGRHNGDALRAIHDGVWNGAVRSRHDLAQDGAGSLNAIHGGAAPVRRGGADGHREYDQHSQGNLFHSSTPIDTTLSARRRLVSSYFRWTRVESESERKAGYSLVSLRRRGGRETPQNNQPVYVSFV